jgi:DNA-directed RNA polymerase specialized sigma24 family protein
VRVLLAEDRRLVRRLLSGDEDTFAEFFELQAPRLYRFALVRLDHDPDAAEEIVQRPLIRVFPELHTYPVAFRRVFGRLSPALATLTAARDRS